MSETKLQQTEPSRRNFKRNRVGGIDCELEHPVYGWIPYTLEPGEAVPDGEIIADADPIPVEVQVAEIRKQVSDTIESLLDAKAVELGYQNFLRAGLYLTSPVQKYKDEAQSLTAWAARMYEYVEALEASLTLDELLNYDITTLELPLYESVSSN